MKVIVLDTETTNTLEEPIAYDFGWAVIDLDTDEVLRTRSFAVAEIFLDKPFMAQAYFAEKIPAYWDEIKSHKRKLATLRTVRFALLNDCKEFGVEEIYAHNARFDYRSATLTQRLVTCSKYRYFFPFGVKICDTLEMARTAFRYDERYINFCLNNDYLCQNGNPRFTAEILYRFLSGDNQFNEEHKGLDDVLIEKEILKACRARGVVDGRLW